ncbi:MAG: cation-translocating P-type ATPase [Culicoidibacterales bacterium]
MQNIKTNSEIVSCIPESATSCMNSREDGLLPDEIEALRKQFGENKIEEKKGEPLWRIFLKNFTSLMAFLLWIGGFIAFFSGTPELGIAIWMVNIINGLFSFFQERKAGKAMDALKQLLPSYARVIRDGKEQKILSEELVPGDIMLIEEGDRISADARLIMTTDLQVNQSSLTGESNPVRKNQAAITQTDLARFEYKNLIFAGTTVASGSGKSVVIATGMETEFGKIANLTQSLTEEKSPLQKELDTITKQISIIAISVGIFFFVAAVFFIKQPIAQAFVFSLGMIVAFIPEGLLPTVTLSLAIAVQRMAEEHALVKKLSSVETLGSTTVICSDKTGTLTQNEMTVNHVWLMNREFEITGLGYTPEGNILSSGEEINPINETDLQLLLSASALCSNARIVPPNDKNPNYTVLGDPTEACLGVAAKKAGIDMDARMKNAVRIRELPFDSTRKRMSTIHQLSEPLYGSTRVSFSKGAPKETIELCNQYLENGQVQVMDEQVREKIMTMNDEYAKKGLRVLAVSYRLLDTIELPSSLVEYTPELIEEDMVFIGLVVMADPPRIEVAEAVKKCHEASIRIIMITGDYGLTAESIAKRIGIVQGENPRVITGMELGKLSDEELKIALADEVIFARVAPEQKYRVVSNLQEMGNIVAVTGDGVNDAPALKKADIGVAMGIAGTDVAKESADLILTDDNFASIVRAVEEGRAVYNNIQKFLLYIFGSNVPEAIPSAVFLLSRGMIPLPLTVMQILSVDLGTDMIPALGLGVESPEAGVMKQPPRDLKKPMLNKKMLIKAFLWYGMLEATIAMGAFFFANVMNGWSGGSLATSGIIYREATTMTLGAIVFCQIGLAMNCRTGSLSVFKVGLFKNKLVNIGILVEIALFCALSYIPFFHELFNTAPLHMGEWIYLLLCPIPMILLDELRKKIVRNQKVKGGV